MQKMPPAVPISNLRNDQDEILKMMDEQPVMLTQRGKARAALVNIDQWNHLMDVLEAYRVNRQTESSRVQNEAADDTWGGADPLDKKSEFSRRRQAEEEAISNEHAAFTQMLPELLREYEGQTVAICNGTVVAHGGDRMDVWLEARKKVGKQPLYIQTVTKAPKIYKVPHRRIVANVAV